MRLSLVLLAGICLSTAAPAADAPGDPPFAFRLKNRADLVKKGGGTTGKDSTEAALTAALHWLARHRTAGAWAATGYAQDNCPEKEMCAGEGSEGFGIGATALALMAFLAAGQGPDSTEAWKDPISGKEMCAGDIVKEALEKLREKQHPDGSWARSTKTVYENAAALMAMADAYAMTGDSKWAEAARKGVPWIVAGQNKDSGWRYQPQGGDADTSATAWCALALQVAEWSGVEVDPAVWKGAKAWAVLVTDDKTWKAGYTGKGTGKVVVMGRNENFEHHETMAAAGAMIRIACDHDARDPALAGAAALLAADTPSTAPLKIDGYYWYWGTLALFQLEGPSGARWKAWNAAMTKALLLTQRKDHDTCLEGSWDPDADRWGSEGGRVCLTAMNALTLTVYSRFKPGVGEKRKPPKK